MFLLEFALAHYKKLYYLAYLYYPIILPVITIHELIHLFTAWYLRMDVTSISIGTECEDKPINLGFDLCGSVHVNASTTKNTSFLDFKRSQMLFMKNARIVALISPIITIIGMMILAFINPLIFLLPALFIAHGCISDFFIVYQTTLYINGKRW